MNLRGNKLGDEGWCAIFDALRDSPHNKIAKWDLHGEGVGLTVVKTLAAYMAVSASLTECRLGFNSLGDEGAESIATALKESTTSKLQTLNMNWNVISPKGATALASYMAVSASLTSCDVRWNSISGDGASELSAAVLANAKLEVFNEIPIKEMRADTLTKLDLLGKTIGPEGGMVLAGLLPVSASLTSLE